ncbi:sulfite exporter TauE/SafE family protein [bacterium]|nr:sulfite exporter TauE/SafE family protein [bacterium]
MNFLNGTKHRLLLIFGAVVIVLIGGSMMQSGIADPIKSDLSLPGILGETAAMTPTGTGKGEIDINAAKGFAGIPGAPKINPVVAFFWALWVGWIFSTVGAFGGVMAGVGHLTLFALGNYAGSFQTTNPALNALLTDTIRASNQYLVGLAALISVYSFLRMKRLVVPLGVSLGIGSVAGGLLIPWFTAGKISLHAYVGYFGLIVLVIGGVIFYNTLKKGQSVKPHAGGKDPTSKGVQIIHLGWRRMTIEFQGTEYGFSPVLAMLGGLVIASISSFIGVGGGFLYVPFLTSVLGLPMYIVAGTSALAVLLSMISSIFSYVVLKGTFISWWLVGIEMAGVFAGALIGPRTQRYIPEIWLKRIFVVLAVYVGIRYLSKGFFGQSWLPPF